MCSSFQKGKFFSKKGLNESFCDGGVTPMGCAFSFRKETSVTNRLYIYNSHCLPLQITGCLNFMVTCCASKRRVDKKKRQTPKEFLLLNGTKVAKRFQKLLRRVLENKIK